VAVTVAIHTLQHLSRQPRYTTSLTLLLAGKYPQQSSLPFPCSEVVLCRRTLKFQENSLPCLSGHWKVSVSVSVLIALSTNAVETSTGGRAYPFVALLIRGVDNPWG